MSERTFVFTLGVRTTVGFDDFRKAIVVASKGNADVHTSSDRDYDVEVRFVGKSSSMEEALNSVDQMICEIDDDPERDVLMPSMFVYKEDLNEYYGMISYQTNIDALMEEPGFPDSLAKKWSLNDPEEKPFNDLFEMYRLVEVAAYVGDPKFTEEDAFAIQEYSKQHQTVN